MTSRCTVRLWGKKFTLPRIRSKPEAACVVFLEIQIYLSRGFRFYVCFLCNWNGGLTHLTEVGSNVLAAASVWWRAIWPNITVQGHCMVTCHLTNITVQGHCLMHHAALNTRRFSRAGRQFSYHRCLDWPWVWVHALCFYASYCNEVLDVVSFGSQTHVLPHKYVVCCTSKQCWGNSRSLILEISYTLNMPHKWFSSALPDICRYINSNWDTATSLHISYNSLFSLSYNSTSFY
jgi:hypothetical protein